MKRLTILIALIIISGSLFSQAWMQYLPQNKTEKELTFFDYQDAFSRWCHVKGIDKEGYYFNEFGGRQKAYGWKQFKRWEIYMEDWHNKKTGEFIRKNIYKEYQDFRKNYPSLTQNLSGNWMSVAYWNEGSSNDGNGRINCIAFHPTDPDVFWVGTAWGGIWATEDHGNTWAPKSDFIGGLGIGAIAIPSDYDESHTIYLGTGDRGYYNDYGVGVLKSTDGGNTWLPTGLSFDEPIQFYVGRLLIHPDNDDVIFAATSGGVFKSTDAGLNWDTLLVCRAVDMEFNPTNPDIIYVSARWQDGDPNTRIYRTVNGGEDWEAKLSRPGCRTELAVSPDDPTKVYAVVANADDGLEGVYRSSNNGASFVVVYNGSIPGNNILGGDCSGINTGGQGHYDLAIAANPGNASEVFVGGVNTWKSTDGGVTWNVITNAYYNCSGSTMSVHVDIHYLAFQYNSDTLFLTSDGGVYFSPNNGSNWTNISGGLVINQPYRIANSSYAEGEIIMGQQDNGIVLWEDDDIFFVSGGDGTDVLINPTDVNNQYFTHNSIYTVGTIDHWDTRFEFETPGDTTNSWFKAYTLLPPDTVYFGAHDLWRSVDRGQHFNLSFDVPDDCLIRRIMVAPSNHNVMYLLNEMKLYRTTTKGVIWVDITSNLPFDPDLIYRIEIKETNPYTLWAALTGWDDGLTVYKSTNGGDSWYEWGEGLPDAPYYDIIQNDVQTGYDELYICGFFGVFLKIGPHPWVPFNAGLPNLVSFDMDMCYGEGGSSLLRVGTHGRGVWQTLLYSTTGEPSGTWVGSEDENWYNPNNWAWGNLPDGTVNVNIPAAVLYYPKLTGNPANVNNITVHPGASLTVDGQTLNIGGSATIFGELNMDGPAILDVAGNINWETGSTCNTTGTGCIIYLDGTWDFKQGSAVVMAGTEVRFTGNASSQLISNSALSKFGKVLIDKSSPYSVYYDNPSACDLVIDSSLVISSTARFTQNVDKKLINAGPLDAQGYFYQQHGTYLCKKTATINLVQPNSYFNDLTIKHTGITFLYSNIEVRGTLDIVQGTLNFGDWGMDLGGDFKKGTLGSITVGTGKVKFNGTKEQKIFNTVHLKSMELNNSSDTLRILQGVTLTADLYGWSSGSIVLDANSNLHIEDLADEAIWGTYRVNATSVLTITNNDGSVNLNGKLFIAAGTVQIYGGTTMSYWPDAANAELHMNSGVLDFKNVGIYIRSHPTYTFLDDITGGLIRTASSFQGDHTSFNPTGGTIELYGPNNADLGHGAGSNFFKVIINKGSATNQPESGEPESLTNALKSGKPLHKKSLPPSGTRANKVTVWDNLDINDQLVITSGELDINGKTVDVSSAVDITGTLTMSNPVSGLNAGTSIYWYPGSSANISEGLITFKTSWQFMSGTNALFTGNNTVKAIGTVNSDIYHKDPEACFANFTVEKTAGVVYLDNISVYPMRVNGNLTVKNGSILNISTSDLIVGGTLLAENTSSIVLLNGGTIQATNSTFKNSFNIVNGSSLTGNGLQVEGAMNLIDGGSVTINNFNLIGILDINAGSVLIHNNFSQFETGHLILDGGTFVIDKPYTGALFGFSGITDLNGGLFEISYDGIKFDTGSEFNINSGNLRVGGNFQAVEPNAFQPAYGAVELINTHGSVIECNNGNFFQELIINKSAGAAACTLAYPTTVNLNLNLQSGELSTMNNALTVNENLVIEPQGKLTAGSSNIYVGDEWINNHGTNGFMEGTSTVYLISGQTCTIPTETFYKLELNKTTGFAQYVDMAAGSTLNITNKLTITDGSLRMLDNCTLNLNGDLHIKNNAGLYANALITSTIINCYGDWLDENTVSNALIGFSPGQSTVNFRGAAIQEITANGGANFYNLNIQKTGEGILPYNNITVISNFNQSGGLWRQLASGLTFTFKGNFNISDPALWIDQLNTVAFTGETYQNLTNTSDGWLILGSLVVTKPTNETLNILSDVSCDNLFVINSGDVFIEDHRLLCQNGLDVNTGGEINFLNDVSLYMGNNASIHINGGNINIWGTSSFRANITRISSGYYEFVVDNGGSITSGYTDFAYMNTLGLQINTNGNIGGDLAFYHCSFSQGEPGGTLLQINNSQDITLNNVNFPANTWSGSHNISKTTDAGNIYMEDAMGDFAGPLFEEDTYNRIHWPSLGIWDGDVSTEWHNAQNWRYNFQSPDANTDVIIPSGKPNYPNFSVQETTVNSLKMEPGTSLTISKDSLTVTSWSDIAGNLVMTGEYSALFADSLVWQTGSSANLGGKSTIYLTGNMFIRQASDLNMNSGDIRFHGNGESSLICHDTAQIANLSNYKNAPYCLSLAGDTLAQLTINGSFENGPAATIKCPSTQEWIFLGALRNTDEGHYRFQNGTIKLMGNQFTYFRPNHGDYFNNLIIETPSRISLNNTYSDTLRVNGDLVINPRSGGTSGIQANNFKIMLRGDWINNAGTTAFLTGVGQTHQVIFCDPYNTQEIRGNTYFHHVYASNESEDGLHIYDQVTANYLMVIFPVYIQGTANVSIVNIDDNASVLHLMEGCNMQIGALLQGGVVYAHGGTLNVSDLNESYITGSYIVDGGLVTLGQTEYSTTHDLYFANLTINGGELKFVGGNSISKWPSSLGGTSSLTMTGGIFRLLNHSVEIRTGNFTENISGGKIIVPYQFYGLAGVTSFHPTGGIVELVDDTDADCGFLEPECCFFDLTINKPEGVGVFPYYNLRVKHELKLTSGYMQLYGNNVIVGP